jgi:hypothetical protein
MLSTTAVMASAAPPPFDDTRTPATGGPPQNTISGPDYNDERNRQQDVVVSQNLADEAGDDTFIGANSDVDPRTSPSDSATPADDGSALELAISDDYLQARYFTGGSLLGFTDAQGHIGLYFSDNRDIIGNVGFMSDPVPVLIDGLSFSAGARGYVALLSDPDDDVVALAPGAQGRFGLPIEFPVYAVASIFYAPDILTLGDAERVLDLDLRLEAQVIENTVAFVGFREFRFDSDEGSDKKAANEFQVGARFAF